MKNSRIRLMVFVTLLMALCCQIAAAKERRSPAQEGLEKHVREAKRRPIMMPQQPGSLWTEYGYNAYLLYDFKARTIDDIVTIVVQESTDALSSGNASTAKSAAATSSFPNFFGLQGRIAELPNLLDGKHQAQFDGKGSTARSQSLSATITAHVIDVLPNGNLVIEAVKEVRVDNENQVLTITGIVRPRDISPANIVFSSAISDMQIKLNGKGIVSDQLKPGWLFRLLTKIFPF